MTEYQNKHEEPTEPDTTVEAMHELIAQNELSSVELLGLIQKVNQEELAKSAFLDHFTAALLDSAPLNPASRVYVRQDVVQDTPLRTIYAVLEESTEDGMKQTSQVIGQEMDGTLVVDPPFDDIDMALARKQLNELQELVNAGMIDLDTTLGAASNITATIEHGF